MQSFSFRRRRRRAGHDLCSRQPILDRPIWKRFRMGLSLAFLYFEFIFIRLAYQNGIIRTSDVLIPVPDPNPDLDFDDI